MKDLTRERLRTLGLAAGVGLGGLAFGYVLVFAAVIVLALAGYRPGPAASVVLSAALLQGVAFGSVAYAYTRYRDAGDRFVAFHVPSLRHLGLAVAGWLGTFAAYVAIALAIQQSGAPTASNEIANTGIQHPEVLLLLLPISFLLIGPGEELLFRGVVQGTLRERFGPVASIVIASVIFASAHFLSLAGPFAGRVVTIAALSVISLLLGALYEYTDNLTVPALVHGAYDATLFGLLYVSVVYGDQIQNAANVPGLFG